MGYPLALGLERLPEEGRLRRRLVWSDRRRKGGLLPSRGECEEGGGDGVEEKEARGITGKADSVWSSRMGVDEARGLKDRGRNAPFR